MKKIVYTRKDGGISILIPTSKEKYEQMLGPLTDDQYEGHIARIHTESLPNDIIKISQIEEEDIPTDREFRDAWVCNDSKVEHDLDKAKDIQLARIRAIRETKFAELDKQVLIAIEAGNDFADLAKEKQKLRDITEPLKQLVPESIDDIKSAFPQELINE